MENKENDITNEEFVSLSSAILARYGVDFTGYEINSFKRRVARAMSVFHIEHIYDLWARLLADHQFIYQLIDEITVGLTAMFRDPVLWTTLKKSVLPKLGQQGRLRFWHAGCSTGEEVYTLGIVLQELSFQDKALALATDINTKAITQARQGRFVEMKMNEYASNYAQYNPFRKFSSYYTLHDEVAHFDANLVRHATFQYHNLVADPMNQKFDVVFCRNVMIYFDTKAKLKLLEQIYQSLNEGGFFVIGFYDALVPLIDNRMFGFYDMEAKIFQKRN